jgi:hypothetical protein
MNKVQNATKVVGDVRCGGVGYLASEQREKAKV